MKNNSGNVNQELIKQARSEKVKGIYRKYGIFIIFVCMFVISSLISPNFIRIDNLVNIVRQNAAITILACGMTVIIISGSIDLSAGAVLTFSGCLASGVMAQTNSVILALMAGIASACVMEWCNSFIITKFDLPPFIATMAMQNIAKGLVQVYTNGTAILGIGSLSKLGSGYAGVVPIPIIIMLACIAITFLFLKYTPLGLYVYSIGGNEKATTASGVNAKKMMRIFFLIHGVFVGLAGVVLMARLNSGQPSLASAGYEFDAIVAVIVGGTSFNGGIGSVLGTLIGALIVGMINNILLLLNIPTMYQFIVKGVLIAGAVILDVKTRARSK